ncbi:MAG: hypothetical protein ABDH28_06355 [Brevinematia bacterium]
MKKTIFSFLVIIFTVFGCVQEDEGKKLEEDILAILNEIVLELKTPKNISLTPRRFIELNAILMVSNYFWTKDIIKTETNVSSEFLEQYRIEKKKELLSSFGLTIEEFENYSIGNYKNLQEFSEKNPDIMEKYNKLSQMLPTLFEDFN